MRLSRLMLLQCLAAWFAASGLIFAVGGDRSELPPANQGPSCTDGIVTKAVSYAPASVDDTKAVGPRSKLEQKQLQELPRIKRVAGRGVKIRANTLLGNALEGKARFLHMPATTSAMGGKVTVTDGWIAYQPPPGLIGDDSFDVTVDDDRGGRQAGVVTVEVADEPGFSSSFVCSIRDDGAVLIRGSGIPGRTYQLQFAPTAASVGWRPLGKVTADANGAWEYVDNPPPGSPPRNYRVKCD